MSISITDLDTLDASSTAHTHELKQSKISPDTSKCPLGEEVGTKSSPLKSLCCNLNMLILSQKILISLLHCYNVTLVGASGSLLTPPPLGQSVTEPGMPGLSYCNQRISSVLSLDQEGSYFLLVAHVDIMSLEDIGGYITSHSLSFPKRGEDDMSKILVVYKYLGPYTLRSVVCLHEH